MWFLDESTPVDVTYSLQVVKVDLAESMYRIPAVKEAPSNQAIR
jgi:hypothetical protein